MGIPPSLLGAERAGPCSMNNYSDRAAAEFPTGRWARRDGSQAPDKAKQGEAIGKHQLRRTRAELLRRHPVAEEDRHAAGVAGACHVDPGVADEPDGLPRIDAARLQREPDRGGIRLVERGVARPDDATEERRPADMIRLAAEHGTGFVADDTEKNPCAGEPLE